MRRYYCNCCGADWEETGTIEGDEELTVIGCPECGAEYDCGETDRVEAYDE